MDRPLGIWILIAFFGWHSLKALETIVRREGTSDYRLFAAIDATYMYWPLIVAIFIADVVAVWVLFRPAWYGFWMVLMAVVIGSAETTIGFLAARSHPDKARAAYQHSRESRGRPITEDALDFVTHPRTVQVLWVLSSMVTLVLAALAVWNRDYFA